LVKTEKLDMFDLTTAGVEQLKRKIKPSSFYSKKSYPSLPRKSSQTIRALNQSSAIDISQDGPPVSSYKFLPASPITKIADSRDINIKYVNAMGQGDERSILNAKTELVPYIFKREFVDLMKNTAFEVIKKSRKTNLLDAISSMKAWNFSPNYVKARPRRDPKIHKWERISSLEAMSGYKDIGKSVSNANCDFLEDTNYRGFNVYKGLGQVTGVTETDESDMGMEAKDQFSLFRDPAFGSRVLEKKFSRI
jgi:hypothetical protein